MSRLADQELIAVMIDLAPYLCVSKVRDYYTEMGTGAPKVRALWVAADVSTGSLAATSGSFDPSAILVVHGVHWLWCDHDEWTVDYDVPYRRERRVFPSKQEAVAFLTNRIETYWKRKRTYDSSDLAKPESPAEPAPPPSAEPR
jgi:hypothetical protein